MLDPWKSWILVAICYWVIFGYFAVETHPRALLPCRSCYGQPFLCHLELRLLVASDRILVSDYW